MKFVFAVPVLASLSLMLAAPASLAATAADQALLDAMNGMMTGAQEGALTGDTDVDFARMMLPHHEAAIEMAKAELRYGADPEMKGLADAVVAAQAQEIALMKAWLAKHSK